MEKEKEKDWLIDAYVEAKRTSDWGYAIFVTSGLLSVPVLALYGLLWARAFQLTGFVLMLVWFVWRGRRPLRRALATGPRHEGALVPIGPDHFELRTEHGSVFVRGEVCRCLDLRPSALWSGIRRKPRRATVVGHITRSHAEPGEIGDSYRGEASVDVIVGTPAEPAWILG